MCERCGCAARQGEWTFDSSIALAVGLGLIGGGIPLCVLGTRQLSRSGGFVSAAPSVTLGWTGRGVSLGGSF